MHYIHLLLKTETADPQEAVKSLEGQFKAEGPVQLVFVEHDEDPYNLIHPVQHPEMREAVENWT